tara:strand:- start:598 stop:810 length:213 start_codon:yes stop_codon:yes gene_type:complete
MTIAELRAERNARLSDCDFYFLTDTSEKIDPAALLTMKLYRQALRDLPAAYEELEEITEVDWPAKPEINY